MDEEKMQKKKREKKLEQIVCNTKKTKLYLCMHKLFCIQKKVTG